MTLKEAIKVLIKDECIEDFIYYVRDSARESNDGYDGNSWDHPRVVAYGEAIDVLEEWLNDQD